MKLLKRLPSWLGVRLNSVKAWLKPDARLDRVQRFVEWVKGLHTQPKLLLELTTFDDSDESIKDKVNLFRELKIFTLGFNKCNLQEKKT